MTLIPPVGDGIADDTVSVQSYGAAGVRLPPGTFRTTADVGVTASGGFIPGFVLKGDHMLRSTILADYNGSASSGAIVKLDTVCAGNYTVGSAVEDIRITQAPGRTGLNGIQLTAAWFARVNRVKVENLSGRGIFAPPRPDINPISDFYQDFQVVVSQSWVTGCAGWGIDFGAGQSPGSYKIQYSAISNNAGGGIRSTTGQCEIIQNLVVGNGTNATLSGGLFFDTVEGPQFVPKVERNEFDTNYNWHSALLRSRGAEFRQNRFLSQTFSSAQGGVFQSGSSFMRPYVHVTLGSGPTNEVWNFLAVRNYHRSVTGPNPTNASVVAYAASGGSLSSAHPVRLERNDFGPMPADGIAQNSTGLVKFSGFTGTGAEIIDP